MPESRCCSSRGRSTKEMSINEAKKYRGGKSRGHRLLTFRERFRYRSSLLRCRLQDTFDNSVSWEVGTTKLRNNKAQNQKSTTFYEQLRHSGRAWPSTVYHIFADFDSGEYMHHLDPGIKGRTFEPPPRLDHPPLILLEIAKNVSPRCSVGDEKEKLKRASALSFCRETGHREAHGSVPALFVLFFSHSIPTLFQLARPLAISFSRMDPTVEKAGKSASSRGGDMTSRQTKSAAHAHLDPRACVTRMSI